MRIRFLPRTVMCAIAAIGFLAGAIAEAHAHLKASSPTEGAVLIEMPAAVVLTFSESARITALSIQKDQDAKQTLTPPVGPAATQISVPVPALGPGAYTLTWRVVSADDNHIMAGDLHFKLAPKNKPMIE